MTCIANSASQHNCIRICLTCETACFVAYLLTYTPELVRLEVSQHLFPSYCSSQLLGLRRGKMHLRFFDLMRGLFTPSTANNKTLISIDAKNYYARGNIRDRGPCPALNALANQGYL
jgi:hypothetical protein